MLTIQTGDMTFSVFSWDIGLNKNILGSQTNPAVKAITFKSCFFVFNLVVGKHVCLLWQNLTFIVLFYTRHSVW